MKEKLKKYARTMAGVIIGGVIGFAYYSFIGCETGG